MAATASQYMRNFSKISIAMRAGNSNHRQDRKNRQIIDPRGGGSGKIRMVERVWTFTALSRGT